MSTQRLKEYCTTLVHLSDEELEAIDHHFLPKTFKKKEYILEIGSVCEFVVFIDQGCVRHFHVKDGDEITCDISLNHIFITEISSFNAASRSNIAFQAMEETRLLMIGKEPLLTLYRRYPTFEELGRKVAETVAERNAKIAMSLASDKPEARYVRLVAERPETLQRVPQKYIANFLGITPESLSRIRKRVATR